MKSAPIAPGRRFHAISPWGLRDEEETSSPALTPAQGRCRACAVLAGKGRSCGIAWIRADVHPLAFPIGRATNRVTRSVPDDRDDRLEAVSPGVAGREVAMVAMVAFQERLPERDGVQLDQWDHDLFRDRRLQGEGVARHERGRIGEPVPRVGVERTNGVDADAVAEVPATASAETVEGKLGLAEIPQFIRLGRGGTGCRERGQRLRGCSDWPAGPARGPGRSRGRRPWCSSGAWRSGSGPRSAASPARWRRTGSGRRGRAGTAPAITRYGISRVAASSSEMTDGS